MRSLFPYQRIEWYVDGTWAATYYGYEDNPRYETTFTPSIAGSPEGKTYEIKVVYYPLPGYGAGGGSSESYSVTVYKTIIDSDEDIFHSVEVYVETSRCKWNGRTSSAIQYARAYNGSDDPILATYKFDYRVVHVNENGDFQGALYIPPITVETTSLQPGESHPESFCDSWALPVREFGLPGDKARLEVRTTLEVWGNGKRKEWNTDASAEILVGK